MQPLQPTTNTPNTAVQPQQYQPLPNLKEMMANSAPPQVFIYVSFIT